MADTIETKAILHSRNIPGRWHFVPVGDVILDDRDTGCTMGELYYENGIYDIGPAIRIKDWVFCLERMNDVGRKMFPENKGTWAMAAFRGMDHYNFGPVDGNTNQAIRGVFVVVVVTEFLPHLCPDLFDGKGDPLEAVKKMAFTAQLFSDQESLTAQLRAIKIKDGTFTGGGYGRTA